MFAAQNALQPVNLFLQVLYGPQSAPGRIAVYALRSTIEDISLLLATWSHSHQSRSFSRLVRYEEEPSGDQ